MIWPGDQQGVGEGAGGAPTDTVSAGDGAVSVTWGVGNVAEGCKESLFSTLGLAATRDTGVDVGSETFLSLPVEDQIKSIADNGLGDERLEKSQTERNSLVEQLKREGHWLE